FKFSVRDLQLKGSVLQAKCRRAGQTEYIRSELDLDAHIGVIDGKLVWGREGFFSACKNVRIEEGFILSADCKTNAGDYVQSSLDLSRYL
ncbi:Cyanovirin-N, partial [Lentinula raphanica]